MLRKLKKNVLQFELLKNQQTTEIQPLAASGGEEKVTCNNGEIREKP